MKVFWSNTHKKTMTMCLYCLSLKGGAMNRNYVDTNKKN